MLSEVITLNETARTINVSPTSELAGLVKAVDEEGSSLVVDTGEARYRLRVDSKEEADTRSSRHRRSLLSFAGIWSDLDADEMRRKLERAHEESVPSLPVKR